MNRLRPLVGAVLTTLMLIAAPAFADEVLPLDPGGGLNPPIDQTGPSDLSPPSVPKDDPMMAASAENDYVEEPVLQTRHFGLQVTLSCQVANTPNAIVVMNHSSEELPPGTRIKWQLKSAGQKGFFALLGPLAGGQTLVADNVLQGRADKGADCTARVI